MYNIGKPFVFLLNKRFLTYDFFKSKQKKTIAVGQ